MGKARREAKLARREASAPTNRTAFSWKETLGRMAKVAPRVLLMTLLLIVLQTGAAALNIPFLSSPLGQLVLFGIVYFLMFRWIYADVLPGRRK